MFSKKAKISKERVEQLKQAGQWPPPEGLIIVEEYKPPKAMILRLLDELALKLNPEQRKIVQQTRTRVARNGSRPSSNT